MKGFVGVTDNDWFEFLSKQPGIDEVNFWQPGGRTLVDIVDLADRSSEITTMQILKQKPLSQW